MGSGEWGMRNRKLYPFSRLPTPDSRLPTPDSRLPTPDSRLPTPDSPFPIYFALTGNSRSKTNSIMTSVRATAEVFAAR
jgi:hypothetical protein